ncbi:MAG: MutT/nudix family protein [Candidatus Saccharibacteria bacterium]|nr:MutT/nudix family protein [Candidatus Saccharibacteria bacterium]
MEPRVGVGVFVIRGGKFLMGHRNGSHGSGTWSIPGGHMEFGESFEQTAKREVMEETGMTIKNVRFGAVTNDFFESDNKHYVTVWVISEWDKNEPQLTEPDKFVDQEWIDIDNLPEPLFQPWDALLKSEFIDEIKQQIKTSAT